MTEQHMWKNWFSNTTRLPIFFLTSQKWATWKQLTQNRHCHIVDKGLLRRKFLPVESWHQWNWHSLIWSESSTSMTSSQGWKSTLLWYCHGNTMKECLNIKHSNVTQKNVLEINKLKKLIFTTETIFTIMSAQWKNIAILDQTWKWYQSHGLNLNPYHLGKLATYGVVFYV